MSGVSSFIIYHEIPVPQLRLLATVGRQDQEEQSTLNNQLGISTKKQSYFHPIFNNLYLTLSLSL